MRAQNRTPPFTRWRADFSFNLHLTKTYPIFALSGKNLIFASLQAKGSFPAVVATPGYSNFVRGVSLARPASFPMRQLTVRRWAAGDCGHNLGNALFSSSVQAVFPATVNFISGCTRADLWHYFFTSFFHTTTLPNYCALCMRSKYTYLAVSTCGVGSPSCSVWLFDTLFNRSKANRRFLLFQSAKKCFQ